MDADRSAILPPGSAKAIGSAFLLIGCAALFSNIAHPRQMDFLCFWAAAKLTVAGQPQAAYDPILRGAVQDSVQAFRSVLPFGHPPIFLIVLAPFGWISYGLAALLWTVAGLALFLLAAGALFPGRLWQVATFPALLINALIGQTGFLTAAAYLAGMRLLVERPWLAGAALAGLIIKPHLMLLIPLALLAGRCYRQLVAMALTALALVALSLCLFGPETLRQFLAAMPAFAQDALNSPIAWQKMVSVYAGARLAGLTFEAAMALHVAIAVMAAGAVWVSWRSDAPIDAKAAVLAAASALASPYLLLYDLAFLLIPLLWLAGRRAHPLFVRACWFVPLLSFPAWFGHSVPVNLVPVASVVLLVLVCREAARASADRQELVSPPGAQG